MSKAVTTSGEAAGRRILKLTTNYDPEEDRLSLAVATDGGVSALLWLSRRLLLRLVPVLAERVQEPPKSAVVAEGGRHSESVVLAAQCYEQLQARLLAKPSPPVAIDQIQAAFLIRECSLSLRERGLLVLDLNDGRGQRWYWVMTQIQLRQWLQMLRGLTRKAQWYDRVWPVWLD